MPKKIKNYKRYVIYAWRVYKFLWQMFKLYSAVKNIKNRILAAIMPSPARRGRKCCKDCQCGRHRRRPNKNDPSTSRGVSRRSGEKKCDFRKASNLLDYNEVDKTISDEIKGFMKTLGFKFSKVELKQIVDEVDRSQSRHLSYKEFATAMMRKVAAKDTDEDLMKSFQLMDSDDSGGEGGLLSDDVPLRSAENALKREESLRR